ncbi:hypothetical protein VV01_18160 [Luteipulveratus halotolerans]|uniref:Arylamine N-acetyltransferase n=2 Tax=Luteipulveratus halotolerans TaxID=1631356 RepID=A0A0L6CLK3_9MICO|nr:hypothetical protein VV01_18160 [Luteipulveratus halotolerans]
MDENRWHIDDLDLDAYLRRVGVEAQSPSQAALGELHTAHVRTFPFENVDVILRQHPGVELSAVTTKFIDHQRGGYCFEHSTLFAAALERLGYDVERHLGRVGELGVNGRTHMVVVVALDGRRYLCDPGFGMSLLRPIPLEDGAEDDQDGWRYRVRRSDTSAAGATWQLQRHRDDEWQLMHTTDELPVHPVDLVMGHHFTSAHPRSHFTRELTVARHGLGRHTTFSPAGLTVRVPGQATERHPVEAADVPGLLRDHGIELPDDQVQRLVEMWPAMVAAAEPD